MKKRSILSSRHVEELRKHRRQKAGAKALVFLLIIGALFVGLGFASEWQRINIQNLEISGNKVVEAKEVEGVVLSMLDGKYLWLFSKTNFLFYPKGKIKKTLAENFLILKDIDLALENANTLKITLTEREAKFTWCGEGLPEDLSTGKCYFMDEGGYIYAEAPYFSGDVYFKFFGRTENNGNQPLGSYFLPEIFRRLVYFRDAAEGMNLNPSFVVVKNDDDAELYLGSQINAPKIIFKLNADIEKTAQNLELVLGGEELKEKIEALQYVDLRFGNKVYFK